jgi:hypothetical protein
VQDRLTILGEGRALDDRLGDLTDRPGPAEFGDGGQGRPQQLVIRREIDHDLILGVSVHLIRTWLAEAGIAIRPAGGRRGVIRPAAWRNSVPAAGELRELYLARRLGRRELAELYQVHPSTVSRWLPEAGLPARLPPAGTLTEAEVVALYVREEIPAAEIARRAAQPQQSKTDDEQIVDVTGGGGPAT